MKKWQIGILSGLLVLTGAVGGVAAFADTPQTQEKSHSQDALDDSTQNTIVQSVSEEEIPAADRGRMDLFYANGFTADDLRENNRRLTQCSIQDPMIKEVIYDRMLNTADYYQTISGKYRRTQLYTGEDYTVNYAVQRGDETKTVEVYQSEQDTTAQVAYYAGNVINRLEIEDYNAMAKGRMPLDTSKVKTVATYYQNAEESAQLDFVPLVRSASRVQEDEEGTPIYYYRQDAIGLFYARESLSPQEMAFGYLEDFSKWDVIEETTVAGRDCYLVEGTLDGDYAQKLHAYDYKLFVDQETGILLQYENYDQNGTLTDKLETLEIEVNQPISDQTFQWYGEQFANAQ